MTGSVADAPGDMSVVLSECWDIDRRTLDSKQIYQVGSGDAVADVYEGDAALPRVGSVGSDGSDGRYVGTNCC